MSKKSQMYHLRTLFPSEEIQLFFEVADELQLRELVATIQCFDSSGNEIKSLAPLAFSEGLGKFYVYLRPYRKSNERWIKVDLKLDHPIARIQVEVLPWNKDPDFDVLSVLRSISIAQSAARGDTENTVNFVGIKGAR